jgi:1A family penicillin-binding protein
MGYERWPESQPDPSWEEGPTEPIEIEPIWDEQPTTPSKPLPRPYFIDEPPQETPPRPPRKPRKGCRGFFRVGVIVVGGIVALVAGAATAFGVTLYRSLSVEIEEDLANLRSMQGVETFETTRITDRDGEVLYEVFETGRRTEVPLSEIPLALQHATVAVEDDTFWENPGFDPPSILRSAYQWYQEGEIVSGASTITQQLVRNIVFTEEERLEQTLRRKLREAALAWTMTQMFTKEEILELYLNEIYYGNLAYGVAAAAEVYFGKPVDELTLAECSFLAGLPQGPSIYDPFTNFEGARERQREVLNLMVIHGYLTTAEAETAFDEELHLATPDVTLVAPHFVVEVRRQLETMFGPEMVARGGLQVTTTLDMDFQRIAEQVVTDQIAEVGEAYNLHNAALVAIDPRSGEVLAMLGSAGYDDETIDGSVNIITSLQQPGSAIKPLTYAAALEDGWTAADVLWDVPVEFGGAGYEPYAPVNYDSRFHGPQRLRDALANSYNIPAVLLLRAIGVDRLLEMAADLGIESLGTDASQYGLSLTLGGGDVTPLELTAAYGAFANGGFRVDPVYVLRVTDSHGNVLYDASEEPAPERVLDRRVAFIITDILSDNAARTPAMGAESPLLLPFPAAVKTGTTNDYRDNWTVGYTPEIVVGVWSGNTDNTPMAEGTSGLTGAAPIWHNFMVAIYEEGSPTRAVLNPTGEGFLPPPGVERRQVCVLSSLVDPVDPAAGCPQHRWEWFVVDVSGEGASPTATPSLPPGVARAQTEVEPGIWQMAVTPLDEATAEALRPEPIADMPQEPPPHYCLIPQEAIQPESQLLFQWFIEAPPFPDDAARARTWAYAHNVPIVPAITCDEAAIAQAGSVQGYGTWNITSPRPNEEVYGVLPIIGTANFDPAVIDFYKIEIGIGNPVTRWVTLGEIHHEPVVNGELEILHADGLPPGQYVLRLMLVLPDGNYPEPYEVPITIVPTPPPE